jgi:hypothetical protein
MGVVYLGHDALLKRDVAIKVLPPDIAGDEERLERFIREAQSAANLSHANTVPVYQIGVDEGHVFIVMEVMEGGSLEDHVRQHGPMPWRDATRAIRDAAAGLAAAHEMGLVHRDIKPANLMRTAKGVTKVADFGLARSREQATQLTQAGSIIGTPAYMAPEQFRGGQADQCSDLYALCCTYYTLLTGRPPFEAPNVPAIMYQHLHVPLPDPRDKIPGLPDAVCRILIRGTQKDPAARYQNAGQLLFQLDTLRAAEDAGLSRGGDWQRMIEVVSAGEHGPGVSAGHSAHSTKAVPVAPSMPRAAWLALAGAAVVAIAAISLVLSQGRRAKPDLTLSSADAGAAAGPVAAGSNPTENAAVEEPPKLAPQTSSADPPLRAATSTPPPAEVALSTTTPAPVEIRTAAPGTVETGPRRSTFKDYSPEQATGPPDTPVSESRPTAWSSYNSDAGDEWLLLEYAQAVQPKFVRVHAPSNPGAVFKVTVIGPEGEEVQFWAGEDPTRGSPGGIAEFPAAGESPLTRRVRIHLDCKAVAGWNYVDSVELVADDDTSQWATAAQASSHYGVGSYAEQAELTVAMGRTAAVQAQATRVRLALDKRSRPERTADTPKTEDNLRRLWEAASGPSKYSMLLSQIERRDDVQKYGDFRDLGYRAAAPIADNSTKGYWVYAAPYWYVWRDLNTVEVSAASWSADQVVGPPDVTSYGDSGSAWASATEDEQAEWLLVEFPNIVVAKRLNIHESYNVGAVRSVGVFRLDGTEVTAWRGSDPAVRRSRLAARRPRKPKRTDDMTDEDYQYALDEWQAEIDALAAPDETAVAVASIALSGSILTNRVKIYIDSQRVPGFNEIDAVELLDASGGRQWASAAEASSGYGVTRRQESKSERRSGELTRTHLDAALATAESEIYQLETAVEKSLNGNPPQNNPSSPDPVTADLVELRLSRLERQVAALEAILEVP